ncbi:hypothetical protein WR25_07624 [Diploscapter pachys]|uniref:Uncharacterized protein n=1 Tax=Diploscapter pachys TaxID=2018661 RepID=A0A2A2M3Z3_9BILA|nr:hypothetical protein WR25_07624 [Diploscapter pachys]
MMMTAMKVTVAFQTMAHTVGMSCSETAPAARAMRAPSAALQPTPSPFGCQMTRMRVKTKTAIATSMMTSYSDDQQQAASRTGRPSMFCRRRVFSANHCVLACSVACKISCTQAGRSGLRR